MRTGSSDAVFERRRGRSRLDRRLNLNHGRKARYRWIELEGLESRTLLATTPAPVYNGDLQDLTQLPTVTTGGNANSPAIAIDPANSNILFAVWGVDLSTITPTPPHTTAIVEGAYSTDAGNEWSYLGQQVAPALLDPLTINADPPTAYTQVTDPTIGFDGKGDVYVLSLETTGATDGALVLTQWTLSNSGAVQDTLPNGGIVYQWVTGSDEATDPTLAVDSSVPGQPSATADNYSGNVYIAWASIDQKPAAASATGYNPDRAELIVGTPVTNPLTNNEEAFAWSPVQTVSIGPQDYGPNYVGPGFGGNDDNFFSPSVDHPQLVVNQNDGGQITVGYDDFSTGAPPTSPPFSVLFSNLIMPGDAYGFEGTNGPIAAATPPVSPSTIDTPVSTDFSIPVDVADPAAIDDLSATLNLVDQEAVSNLQIVLYAPHDVGSITLVQNQINDAAKANTGVGLPSGNSIGVYGFTTGATGVDSGLDIGTIFDDNATRNIFDPSTTGTNANSAAADGYIGYFQPEGYQFDPIPFNSLPDDMEGLLKTIGPGNINGTWTLVVTNYSSTAPATGVPWAAFLDSVSLQFGTTDPALLGQNGGVSRDNPSEISFTYVLGALGNTYANKPPSDPSSGIGPGLVLAIDNTLGSSSPYAGRIYAAYVGYSPTPPYPMDPNGHTNPSTDTDIYLVYSDNGGQSWSSPVFPSAVNDNNSDADGISASDPSSNDAEDTFGRTVFQPAIAVDPESGTLVISWRDARDDAADARVATYLTTSIDGGNTFSAQTYANPQASASFANSGLVTVLAPQSNTVDAITGDTVVTGPESDNLSSGNAQADAAFGYGNQMGLAVFGGQVYPMWAGNLDQTYLVNGTTVTSFPLNIFVQPMVIAAGPRIINSTMGPISLAEAESGKATIVVTFDRAIDPNTFGIGNVSVYYHGTSETDSFVGLTVTGVSPIANTDDTEFKITFDPLPKNATASTYDYTGTYSYLIAPDAGPGTTPISAPVYAYVNGVLTEDADDQNADGTSDENALTSSFTGTTPGDVYAVPAPATPPEGVDETFDGYQSILRPQFGENPSTLPLIVPGPQVTGTSTPAIVTGTLLSGSTSVTGISDLGQSGLVAGQIITGTGIPAGTTIQTLNTTTNTITLSAKATASGSELLTVETSLVLNGTSSTLNVTFDRPMVVNTAAAGSPPTTGSFSAADVLSIMGPAGPITGPQYFPSNVQTGQAINNGTLTSDLTIPSFGGTFTIADITVSMSIAFQPDEDLTATLVSPLGTQVTLFSGVGGDGANFINTTLDDSAETSITSGSAPFTGSFQPQQSLSILQGQTVDFKNSAGVWDPGVWQLVLTSSNSSVAGMLDNWSLAVTPVISVNPVVSSDSNGGADATQFIIGFPMQELSGTYTIQVSPTVQSEQGDALDVEQDAGLDVLRGTDQNGPTTTVVYPSSDLPKQIPAPTPTAPSTVTSTITVPDNFLIEGDKTAAGASVMTVEINVTYPNDPDLTATLTHYDSAGDNLGTVTLFSDVGAGSDTANFENTIFDDNAVTPIQEGGAPFSGTYDPQLSLATKFAPAGGESVQGTWVLTITNDSAAFDVGTFNSWSLTFQKPEPTSGLGVPGENFTGSFRIFNLAQSNALSSEAWTAVGPASIGGGAANNGSDPSGRVSGLAIDPSDPSGNTVYAAGASGGIWKTTDFLTTNPAGPTWIPLTDFGPTSGVNIGGITIFPRNDNPNDSIVIAATGEGDTGTPGVGFLISEDGGATWNLYDSTVNVDANGNLLPIESTSRNREFVGDSAFQVTVDPTPSASGGVIIYAALSGPTGGIWRSEDTGATWQLMRAGQATSVVLAPESGELVNPATGTYVTGNELLVYAAFRGDGVYLSPNQGEVWDEMLGGIGNPLIVDEEFGPPPNVNPINGPTPNGAEGRIELAVPSPTGNAAEDAVYEGWLYAIVSTPNGLLNGIFVTKDFGENWTEVNIPTEPNEGYQTTPAIPANDVQLTNYSVIGSTQFPQGNYNMAIAVDPQDPSVLYIGGTRDGNQSGLIRINLTDIWDAHNLTPYDYDAPDNGAILQNSTGPAVVPKVQNPTYTVVNFDGFEYFDEQPFVNLIRNPGDPFVNDATIEVYNYSQFTNNGAGVSWVPFDSQPFTGVIQENSDIIYDLPTVSNLYVGETVTDPYNFPGGTTITSINTLQDSVTVADYASFSGTFTFSGTVVPGTDYHRMVAMVDPTTGLTRLIFGNDQGIWSVLVNADGTPVFQVGNADPEPMTSRNGNLQITQFYDGASQPSNAAAQIAEAMYYGSAQDNGAPMSSSNIIDTGDIVWNGPGGDSSGVATNQQGTGTIYQYWWPCCGGADTDFFQVNGVGETYGLLQASGGDPTPDPQWPFGGPGIGIPFAVDPVNGQDIVISSNVGRIFTTTNGGVTWFDVGDPVDFNTPGNWSVALAYGAPDPNSPSGTGDLGNFIYVGTQAGQIFVTQNGGGSGTSNNWLNISLGLDGAPVQQIITDPTRGSHDAYAVTRDGVFYIADSILLADNPNDTAYEWVNITGNLQQLAYSIFGQNYNPTTDPDSPKYTQAVELSAIAADWRYAIPNATASSDGPQYHPVLYVGAGDSGGTGSGVFQSLDGGVTWTYFPDTAYGAVTEGGYLPHVAVTSLSLSLGDINVQTGMPTLDGPDAPYAVNQVPADAADADTLMASTYGQGAFAINLAPLIVGNQVTVSPTVPGTSELTGPIVGGQITVSGESEITGFGNATWITIDDVTDPATPTYLTGFNPADATIPTPGPTNSTSGLGAFSFTLNPQAIWGTNYGLKTIEVFATDNAGSVGNKVLYTFNWDPATQLVFSPTGEPPANGTTGVNFATPNPVVVDAEDSAGNIDPVFTGPVTLSLFNNTTASFTGTLTVNAVAGVATFNNLVINNDGTYNLEATSTYNTPTLTPGESTSISLVGPATQLYVIQEPPSQWTAGDGYGFEVGAEDAFNNPTTLSGSVTVELFANPGNTTLMGTTTVTAGGGVALFSGLSLDIVATGYQLEVTSTGLTDVLTTDIQVVAAPASQLVLQTGPPSSVTAGQTFPIVVDAEDPFGNLDLTYDGSLSIAFANNAIGVLTGNTTTASMGVASFPAVAIDTVGKYQLVISSSPALTTVKTKSITVTAATAAKMIWTQEPPAPPNSVTHNFDFNVQLDVEDQYGNLETGDDTAASIMFLNNPTGATLGGNTTIALAGGVANFTGLTVNTVGTGYTLIASSGTLTSPASTAFNVTPTPAASLEVTTQPPSMVTVAQGFGFQVTALDTFGNPDPDFDGIVTVSVATGPSSSLGGTLTAMASNGVATFSGLTLTTVGSGYSLAVSTPGATGTTTNTFQVVAAQANKILVTTEPPMGVPAGGLFGLTVEAFDQYNNLATGFTGTVTLAIKTGPSGAVLGGPTSVAATGGVVNFANLFLDTAGSYTLSVSSSGLTTVYTDTITVAPLTASQLLVSAQPPSVVTAGAPFGLTVSALDAFGNLATSFTGSITVALSGAGGPPLNGTLQMTATSGMAVFSGLSIDLAGAGYTLTATGNNPVTGNPLTSTTSNPFTVNPASPTTLVVSISPPTVMTAGALFGLAIAADDPFGNLATQFTGNITIAIQNNPGNAKLNGGPLTVAASGGVSNFHAFITNTSAAAGYTLLATSAGLSSVTAGPIQVIPAAPYAVVVVTQPPSVVAPGSSFGFVAAIEDQYGNVETTDDNPVSVAVPSGATSTLGGTTTVTAASGLATFSGLTLTQSSTTVALQVTSPNVASTATNPITVGTPAQVAFSTGSVTVNEATGSATLGLVRTGEFQGAVTVTVATSGGTAVAGVNYTPIDQTVTFAAGQDNQTVTVPIKNVGALSSNLTVNVGLSNPGAGATLGSLTTSTVTIEYVPPGGGGTPPPTPPLVTLAGIVPVKNKKKLVDELVLDFSGALNATEAATLSEYSLILSGKHNSFTGRGVKTIKLKGASYSSSSDEVTLTIKKPFKLTKKPLELTVDGVGSAGLHDAEGRLIDGANNGQAGSDAVVVFSKSSTVISAIPAGPMAVKVAKRSR
jgi:large repetitive protein